MTHQIVHSHNPALKKKSLAEALQAHAAFDERASLNPVDIRARNVPLTPCTFINAGGISQTFDRLLITAFGADDSMIPVEFGAFTFSMLQHCRNVLTATIANAHAESLPTTSFGTCARRSSTVVKAKSVLLDGTVMLTTPTFTLTPLLTPVYM